MRPISRSRSDCAWLNFAKETKEEGSNAGAAGVAGTAELPQGADSGNGRWNAQSGGVEWSYSVGENER